MLLENRAIFVLWSSIFHAVLGYIFDLILINLKSQYVTFCVTYWTKKSNWIEFFGNLVQYVTKYVTYWTKK